MKYVLYYFLWVWKVVCQRNRRTHFQEVWEQNAEEIIWTKEKGCSKTEEKTVQGVASKFLLFTEMDTIWVAFIIPIYGKNFKFIQNFRRKTWRRRPFRRYYHTNIDLEGIGKVVIWIHLVQRSCKHVNELTVSKEGEIFY